MDAIAASTAEGLVNHVKIIFSKKIKLYGVRFTNGMITLQKPEDKGLTEQKKFDTQERRNG